MAKAKVTPEQVREDVLKTLAASNMDAKLTKAEREMLHRLATRTGWRSRPGKVTPGELRVLRSLERKGLITLDTNSVRGA